MSQSPPIDPAALRNVLESPLSDRAKLVAIAHLRHNHGQAPKTLREIRDSLGGDAAGWYPNHADEAEYALRAARVGLKNRDGSFQLVPGAFGAPSKPEAEPTKAEPVLADAPLPAPVKDAVTAKKTAKPKAGRKS